jgi:spore germination protein YaaH
LEEFLIANREEYLRHSALNYSAKQKHFNNKLTEQVLELATQHGYVFQNFSFVMLRDKIRCYYKSYLQALRKKQQKKER